MYKNDFKVNPWQVSEMNFPLHGTSAQKMSFLLRYAVLAPSSHNTQPWRFQINENEILVFTDELRWLKVADANRREIYLSLGCAIENMLIAGERFGFSSEVRYFPDPDKPRLVAAARFTADGPPSGFRGPHLFAAITARHTSHGRFDGRPVPAEDLAALAEVCAEPGISLFVATELETRRVLDRLVNESDAVLFANPAFREELTFWINQGSFGPPWLIGKLSQLATSYLEVNGLAARSDADLLYGAPVFAALLSDADDPSSQVRAGQSLERIYLRAMTLGIGLQPMSQLLEVASVKNQLGDLIAVQGAVIQQPMRIGYAEPERLHTPRRPLMEAMV